MKKIIQSIGLIGAILFLGCQDFLDVQDLDQLTSDSVFKTEKDMQFALNHLYTFLPTADVINSGALQPYLWTDDAIHRNINGGQGPQGAPYDWRVNAPYLSNFYNYSAIADINFFLDALEGASFTSEEIRNRYGAEARFFRAFIYEGMVMAYGDVALVTEILSPEDFPARDSREEVFDFVINELSDVVNLLPSVAEYGSVDKGRITKEAALAMKARAYLNALGWHNNQAELYAGAEAACAAIVGAGSHSLDGGIDGFAKQFTRDGDFSSETVLANIYVPEFRTHALARRLPPKGAWRGSEATFGNNQSRIGYTSNLIEEFQTINGLFPKDDPSYDPADPWVNRDPRLAVSAIVPGDILPSKGDPNKDYVFQPHPNINPNGKTDNITRPVNPTGYNLRKYLDFNLPALDRGDADYKIIRYSEVLLMYAESLAGLGDETGALTYLDMVRDRVGMPKYADIGLPTVTRGTTGNQMIDAILLERRYEFAGEGPQRWFDIWRYRLGDQVINQVFGIPESKSKPGDLEGPKFKPSGDLYNRVWDDKFYLLPIPLSAIDANPNLSQNPGW